MGAWSFIKPRMDNLIGRKVNRNIIHEKTHLYVILAIDPLLRGLLLSCCRSSTRVEMPWEHQLLELVMYINKRQNLLWIDHLPFQGNF